MKIHHFALATAILCAPAICNPLLAQSENPSKKKDKKLVESAEADAKARASGVAMSAGEIKGAEVRSPDGTGLGDISDVVVERSTGMIKLALVSVGGFLGIGEKVVAVPWSALSPAGTDKPSFILDATRGELETAPGVESSSITNASYRDWLKWGDDYFGHDRKRPAAAAPASSPAEKKARVKQETKRDGSAQSASSPAGTPAP